MPILMMKELVLSTGIVTTTAKRRRICIQGGLVCGQRQLILIQQVSSISIQLSEHQSFELQTTYEGVI